MEDQDQQLTEIQKDEETDEKVYETFEQLCNDGIISEQTLEGLLGYGFEKLTPVQKRAIVPLVQGKNGLFQAPSGTGKTGAFVTAALTRIQKSADWKQAFQVLVLTYSRELAEQITKVFNSISAVSGIKAVECIGGIDAEQNQKKLKKLKPQIVVGTQGRIDNFIQQKYIKTQNIHMFIVDEFDELMTGNQEETTKKIFKSLPSNTQIALFSATYDDELDESLDSILKGDQGYVTHFLTMQQVMLAGLKQYYVQIEREDDIKQKLKLLYYILTCKQNQNKQSIVFVNKLETITDIQQYLEKTDVKFLVTFGKMMQKDRDEIIEKFKKVEARVLITTNVLARGIDIQTIQLVVNFELPKNVNTYIHRIGRTCRYGRKGEAINILQNQNDTKKIQQIEEIFKMTMDNYLDLELDQEDEFKDFEIGDKFDQKVQGKQNEQNESKQQKKQSKVMVKIQNPTNNKTTGLRNKNFFDALQTDENEVDVEDDFEQYEKQYPKL